MTTWLVPSVTRAIGDEAAVRIDLKLLQKSAFSPNNSVLMLLWLHQAASFQIKVKTGLNYHLLSAFKAL